MVCGLGRTLMGRKGGGVKEASRKRRTSAFTTVGLECVAEFALLLSTLEIGWEVTYPRNTL